MATITLRVNEQENKLIKDYVKINNYNLSSFIRDVKSWWKEDFECIKEIKKWKNLFA